MAMVIPLLTLRQCITNSQGDYCATKPPALDPTIDHRSSPRRVAHCNSRDISFRILRKNIAWDFGSRISSKISARISASASNISACCGPLASSDIYIWHYWVWGRSFI